MNKKKKTILLSVLGVLLVIAIIVGTTYAFWKVTKVQEGEANTLTTTCLDVDLTSMSNGINLQTQFPITDEEGRKTEGYIFKISNKCNTYVSYDINLESLNNVTEENKLNLNNLVAIIDDGNVLQLGYYPTTTTALKTNEGTAYDTRKLVTDTLSPGSTTTPTSKEYTLRVWLDEDTTEEAMNKEWNGKISITASPVIAENAVVKLTELAKTNTEEMFTDDTADANIRYMGPDPANYVAFGNEYYSEDLYYGFSSNENEPWYPQEYTSLEACQAGRTVVGTTDRYNTSCTKIHSKGDPILWRVIGVMNNVDDGTGIKETRIKLIRDENIGNHVYDATCENGELTATGNCKVWHSNNNWETSDIRNILNNDYYNKMIGSEKTGDLPPTYDFGKSEKPDFTNNGMTTGIKNLIKDAVYYLGGPFDDNFATWMMSDWYAGERNPTQIYKGNPTSWTGKLGLMYVSDYAYATNGGESGKEYCNNYKISSWSDDDCAKNSWILGENYYSWEQWTMTPYSANSLVIAVYGDGTVYNGEPDYAFSIRPVVYLKSDVKIMGGDGTKENPYKLGL